LNDDNLLSGLEGKSQRIVNSDGESESDNEDEENPLKDAIKFKANIKQRYNEIKSKHRKAVGGVRDKEMEAFFKLHAADAKKNEKVSNAQIKEKLNNLYKEIDEVYEKKDELKEIFYGSKNANVREAEESQEEEDSQKDDDEDSSASEETNNIFSNVKNYNRGMGNFLDEGDQIGDEDDQDANRALQGKETHKYYNQVMRATRKMEGLPPQTKPLTRSSSKTQTKWTTNESNDQGA
jgi:hypothetical protein